MSAPSPAEDVFALRNLIGRTGFPMAEAAFERIAGRLERLAVLEAKVEQLRQTELAAVSDCAGVLHNEAGNHMMMIRMNRWNSLDAAIAALCDDTGEKQDA